MRVPSGKTQIGKREVIQAFKPKLGAGLLVACKLDPFEAHVAPLQKIADGVSLRRPTLAIKAYSGGCCHK